MSLFGQNNNQQQGTGFGGFGSTNNNTGFGQTPTTGAGFGSGTTTFGDTTANNTSGFGGFGSGGTGFGSTTTTNSPFGQQNKPAFGAAPTTTGGGLFGGSTATAAPSGGFGGFGSTNNATAGGGLFGTAPKTTFGTANTGGGLFGSSNTGGGFGSAANNNAQQQQPTGAFGASVGSALGQNTAECQGTGSTAFSAFTEKEGSSSVTNHFQSISFMQPYSRFSFEELRFADYNQGRRFGNGSGQAGAFGSTNFGGFGQAQNTGGFGQTANTSGGGLFGTSPASAAPFGQSQQTTSGFGAQNSGGGLFGAQKPGGLFGQTATSAQPSGGLFGTAGATSGGGFGSGNTGGGFGSGGASLFGQNNQQQQAQQSKPFSFGGTTATAGGFGSGNTGNTGFGSTNTGTGGGGLFGQANQTNSGFGQQNQQQPAQTNPFSGFGQQNQNQQQSQTNTTPNLGGFGQQNQDQKPGGLFGSNNQTSTNTGAGLFGNGQQSSTGGGLFGQNNNTQPSGGSLFGKPATGGGLFGQNNTSASNTGGGLFGGLNNTNSNNSNQNQQAQGGGLFGANNSQQPKPSGLFGGSGSNTGGGLFGQGNNNQQPQTSGSLFGLGSNNQQSQQGGGLFGGSTANNTQGSSLLGNPQQQQAPQNAFQPGASLQTTLMDPNAFGSPSIFTGLPPPPQVSGPIATPINTKNKMKKSAILPHYKITPNAASRLQTPQRRGYGFSYSTYGTPGSASSNASTPGGLGSSLLYGSVSRGLGLGKSLSTSNLRRNYDDAESILTPGAFSAGNSKYGSGSMKKLTIDRSLRTDLFGDKGAPAALPSPDKERQTGILKKKVSFDASTMGGNGEKQIETLSNGNNSNNVHDSATPSAEEQGFLRSPLNQARVKQNGISAPPETEQSRGNELAVVHEDESPESLRSACTRAPSRPQEDPQAGTYWMKPSKEVLQKMSKEQLQHVPNFSVGRDRCGHVDFGEPVDLTLTPLDDIYITVVLIELRSLTVYPDQLKKPALGKGLNVPSTIYLGNSWPRLRDRKTLLHEKSGPRFSKHVDRLRKVGGTEFVRYEKDTGTWVFRVPHFTTYGFDYEDDASVASEGEMLNTSVLSEPPDTPTPQSRTTAKTLLASAASTQQSLTTSSGLSRVSTDLDDTFEFRKQRLLPGAFDDAAISDDEEDHEMEECENKGKSFLDERLAASPSESGEDEPSELEQVNGQVADQSLVIRDDEKTEEMDMGMAGAFPLTGLDDPLKPNAGTPAKGIFNVSGDWTRDLQRTISPRKQDRQALREEQAKIPESPKVDQAKMTNGKRPKTAKAELATSIDLMNSLFGQEQAKRAGRASRSAVQGKGSKWPYHKLTDSGDKSFEALPIQEQQWHTSHRPHWGPKETLLYSITGKDNTSDTAPQSHAIMNDLKSAFVSEGNDIRLAKFAVVPNLITESLRLQRSQTTFRLDDKVPMAHPQLTPFKDLASAIQPDSEYEQNVWALACILFDDQDSVAFGIPVTQKDEYDHRTRKDRLIEFWERLCEASARKAVDEAPNAEERAIAYLSANKVVDACDALVHGKDFRLAILIAQIGGDTEMREDMLAQIDSWRELNVLSEMTEPIRALYSLLAGNTCICEGRKGSLEDRARTFVISERFHLDWKRAFALRLCFAILAQDPIETAVKKYEDDLKTDEGRKPVPWYVESQVKIPWEDPHPSQREDILWGLLKLYAASKNSLPAQSLANTIMPENIGLNPTDVRLSFQLYYALALRLPSTSSSAAGDALAKSYTTQLDSAGEWLWALFASLHLSDAAERRKAIQTILAHHAQDIRADPPDDNFQTLTRDMKIPEKWIWQAKALYARSVTQDHVREVEYLVKASDWDEAHEVLRNTVGPTCVIGEEWDTLQGLIDSFKAGKENLNDWGIGGQVYADYLDLMKGIGEREKIDALNRLLEALPYMTRGKPRSEDGKVSNFNQMVAVQEIRGVVGREVLAMQEKGIEGAEGLKLPRTEDAYLKHTTELSQQYYKAVMVGAK